MDSTRSNFTVKNFRKSNTNTKSQNVLGEFATKTFKTVAKRLPLNLKDRALEPASLRHRHF